MQMILCKNDLPKESKPYLVQFCIDPENHSKDWFEVINFQAKCRKWKRLDWLAYAWCELPTSEDQSKNDEYKQDIINKLDDLKRNHPDQHMIIETPQGSMNLRIGNSLIYEGMNGEIVIDSE